MAGLWGRTSNDACRCLLGEHADIDATVLRAALGRRIRRHWISAAETTRDELIGVETAVSQILHDSRSARLRQFERP